MKEASLEVLKRCRKSYEISQIFAEAPEIVDSIFDAPELVSIRLCKALDGLAKTACRRGHRRKMLRCESGCGPSRHFAALRNRSLWVNKRAALTACRSLPVLPHQRTLSGSVGMSQTCHEWTLAVQPLTTELDGELPVRRRRSLLAIRRAPDARRPDLCQPIWLKTRVRWL